ncbi:MAG: hypothetical protein IMZ60_00175, partial [Actinobacteria bacterium]|nr:hypothetical protein [Actinomycetota bacterium]
MIAKNLKNNSYKALGLIIIASAMILFSSVFVSATIVTTGTAVHNYSINGSNYSIYTFSGNGYFNTTEYLNMSVL